MERFHRAQQLRRFLEAPRPCLWLEGNDRAEPQRRGVVGSGKFLRADDDVFGAGKRGNEKPEQFRRWAGESRGLGARAREFAWRDPFWQGYRRLLPPAEPRA